jgi:hypothetical protein
MAKRGRKGIDGVKLSVVLAPDQVAILQALAQRRRVSVAALVREAVDRVFLASAEHNNLRIDD